ncbi:uncharacterized protein LOC131158362 [Malania oleifera]|uniref:uncharacterized protein LOC131158362 n=1 Tax=Malania oleifera TaxID=397392 RepID=UPI0025ADD969|nr:uncharacterized protein LOC131158362 [Malania oleifera]
MNYHSTGRNQRPGGFKVKSAIQFTLLLAISIWLLYQAKHPYHKRKDYGGSLQSKLIEKHRILMLGRKGNAGLLSDGDESDLEDEDLVGEAGNEDGGGGNNEFNRNSEIKDDERSLPKARENTNQNAATHGEKTDGKVKETESKGSQEDNVSDIEGGEGNGSVSLNKDIPGQKINEGDTVSTQIIESDEALGYSKGDDENEAPIDGQEVDAVQSSGRENAPVHGHSEMENEAHGFQDKNGVPHDGNDVLESRKIASNDNQSNILPQGTISRLGSLIGLSENVPVEGMDVLNEGSYPADSENESKSIIEGLKNDITVKVEIKSETRGAINTLSSNGSSSVTTNNDSVALEDSHPLSFQQEREVDMDGKIFPQDSSVEEM